MVKQFYHPLHIVILDKYDLKGLTPKEIERSMGEFDVDKVAAWMAEHHPEKHFDAADAQRLKQGVLDGRVFNPAERSRFIVYLDANNLYGWAMSNRLPTGNFEWLDVGKIDPSNPPPSFLGVDLKYPDHLHDHFNDYVPGAESIIPPGGKTSRLAPNLMPKERYVRHYQNLNQLVKLGVKVTRVHRALGFVESNWLRPYIELNTKLRAAAKNDFERDFFKLANNAVFGKTCENILNRVDVRLATTKKRALKLLAKPEYRRFTIFSKNMIGIHLAMKKVKMNKPSYVRVAVLELSKTLMLNFHYGYAKPKWGDDLQLLMTDTDSFIYEIQTDDFFADIAGDVPTWFDTSNFPKEGHPSCIAVGQNKKVVGLMKSETGGEVIHEFVGLRAKLYALTTDEKVEKKAQGVKSGVVKSGITFDDYRQCVV